MRIIENVFKSANTNKYNDSSEMQKAMIYDLLRAEDKKSFIKELRVGFGSDD